MEMDDLENDSPKTICVHAPLGGDMCTHPSWKTTDPHRESGKHFILGAGVVLQGNVKECDRSGEQSPQDGVREVAVRGSPQKKMELINVLAGTEQDFMSLWECRGFILHQYLLMTLVRLSD